MKMMNSLLFALLITEAIGKGSEEKFKLSEDCVHKHPNHQLPNIAGKDVFNDRGKQLTGYDLPCFFEIDSY